MNAPTRARMPWLRRRLVLLSVAVVACGHRCDRTDGVRAGALLGSTDRVAVYDAGVGAYRAKDYATARRLWRRAADLGDHEAASNLGFLLYYGFGGRADSLAGAAFWRRAAAQQDAEAHRHLAQAIVDGDGRLGSLEDAYGHAVTARLLALRPHELDGTNVAADAERLADALAPRLTAAQRAAAERVGRQWAADTGRGRAIPGVR